MTPGTRSPDATPEAVRAAACVRVRLIPALGLVTVECSFLFERLGPVNPFFVFGGGTLISLSALWRTISDGSCPGFSIRVRAVRRPESSWSLPGQDRGAGGWV
jgi:hypothetical protein